jgi:hypothetical protein
MREDRGTTPFPFATMEDRIAMVEEEYLSPSNDTLDQYRIEAVGATFDELADQEQVVKIGHSLLRYHTWSSRILFVAR